jgi:hypothetical protein
VFAALLLRGGVPTRIAAPKLNTQPTAEALAALLARFSKLREGAPRTRYWIGPTPKVERELVPYVVALELGYETPETSARSQDELRKPRSALTPIERSVAAETLAFAAAEGIAYGRQPPQAELTVEALNALHDLGSDACFFSNGDWPNVFWKSSFGFSGISDATFDAGVVGFDRRIAFIFWMEDED